MSREELLNLATDMDRLIGAGAATAAGSEKLRSRGKLVEQLAKKVPGLVPLAAGIDTLLAADSKTAPSALFDLLVMTQTLRRSLTTNGVTGEMEPIPIGGEWSSPLSTRAVESLMEVITDKGSNRPDTLTKAFAEKQLLDLRLVDPMMQELANPHSPLERLLAEEVLPAFGIALVPELLTGIDLGGKAHDARKLAILCRLDNEKGRALCRKALIEGSVPVKAKALGLLSIAEEPDLESIAIELSRDKNKEVREAAIHLLGKTKSEAAFNRLLEVLQGGEGLEVTARIAMTEIGYPETTPRCVTCIDTIIEESKEARKALNIARSTKSPAELAGIVKTSAKSKKKTEVEKLADKVENYNNSLARLLIIISDRKDDHRREAYEALIRLTEMGETPFSNQLLNCFRRVGYADARLRDYLEKSLQSNDLERVGGTVSVFGQVPPEVHQPSLPKLLALFTNPHSNATIKRILLIDFLPAIQAEYGNEILTEIRSCFRSDSGNQLNHAIMRYLKSIGVEGKALLPELLDYIGRYPGYDHWIEDLLVRYDPEGTIAIPRLIEYLSAKGDYARCIAADCLGRYGKKAAAAIPELERLKDKPSQTQYPIENALRLIRD